MNTMFPDYDAVAESTGGHPYDGMDASVVPPRLPVDPTLKVVFVDFDGVLNGPPFPIGGPDVWRARPHRTYDMLMDRRCIAHLNAITDATDARIVVSSSWRFVLRHSMEQFLKHIGVTGTYLSMTPFGGWKPRISQYVPRGREIEHWLRLFQRAHGFQPAHVAVLDDADVTPLNSYAVYTRSAAGLELRHVTKAISMLARPFRFRVLAR